MGLDRAASIDDLRLRAKRRIPRFAFDLVDGGAESERNMRRNIEAFEEVELTPRYMVDVSEIDTQATLFGQTYDAPFGMAPIGMLNAFWPDADLTLAKLCKRHNIPYVASSAASTTLEALAKAADGNGWFQLYVSSDADVTEGLIARAEAAGYTTLVVTADVPAAGKRDRDIRNQLSVPFRFTPEVLLQCMLNPRWALTSLRHGTPNVANYADLLQSATSYADVQKTLITPAFTWDDLKRLRARWKGKLLVKGILHPQDAETARSLAVTASSSPTMAAAGRLWSAHHRSAPGCCGRCWRPHDTHSGQRHAPWRGYPAGKSARGGFRLCRPGTCLWRGRRRPGRSRARLRDPATGIDPRFQLGVHKQDTTRYPSDLTDAEWAIVGPLLPGPNRLGRPRTVDLRRVWDAIQYLAAAGCAWSLLPKDFPPVSTVRYYFHSWRNDGLVTVINRDLVATARRAQGRDARPTAGVIDSQSVKTSENTSLSGFDAGKRIKGRKRHIITDTCGNQIACRVHMANIQDRDSAPGVFSKLRREAPHIRHVFADGGYAGPKLRGALVSLGVCLRRRPSDLGINPMISPTLCPTSSTAHKSRFCPQPMAIAAGIGPMMRNCASWRRASSATARRQPRRGGMAFADHC